MYGNCGMKCQYETDAFYKIEICQIGKFEFMEDKADEQQKDNDRSYYRNNRSNTLERCFYKCLK